MKVVNSILRVANSILRVANRMRVANSKSG